MSKQVTKEIDLNGRKLKLETGYLAQQADAAVIASWGETVALCTVATKVQTEDIGYFPLSVEYVEKYYAGGRITAQKFIKRENRPTEEAILTGRAIDRSIRPLFPKDFRDEVQVIITILSYDGVNDPGLLGLIGVAAALAISSVPFNGPLGPTKIALKGDQEFINPTIEQMTDADLDLLVASTKDKVAMIEARANQIPDDKMYTLIEKAHQSSQEVIKLIEDFTKEAGKEKIKLSTLDETIEGAVLGKVKGEAEQAIKTALFDKDHPWHEATGDMIKAGLAIKYADNLTPLQVSGVFDKVAKQIMHETVLGKGQRVDGRAMDEVRPINIKFGLLPRTHGSAVFERGSTQVLSITTLGPLSVSQTLEGMTGESTKRFMHHYNMSINPFSVGEIKRISSPSRRDIGHGALVEKSLLAVLPSEEEFPYAMRVVSEVLAANASTSMASLCASTLSLLNAGVPLKNPVAGIALGLLSDEKKFQVFTDMQAVEDFYGEMDFKITGTENGIAAIQMDTKLPGVTFEVVKEALTQGSKARKMILGKIHEALPKAAELSKYAPKIEVTHIQPEEIGLLIGSGGKTINALIARTGAQVDIEENGTVMVSSSDEEAIKKAIDEIKGMFRKVQVDEEYEGRVVKIATFGAFVEITPGKEGLVHISQMAPGRVERPEDVVSVGQTVKVRVTDVSPEGKIGLSMLFGGDRKPESEGRPAGRPSGGPRRSFGGGGRSGGFGGGFGRSPRRDFNRDRGFGGGGNRRGPRG